MICLNICEINQSHHPPPPQKKKTKQNKTKPKTKPKKTKTKTKTNKSKRKEQRKKSPPNKNKCTKQKQTNKKPQTNKLKSVWCALCVCISPSMYARTLPLIVRFALIYIVDGFWRQKVKNCFLCFVLHCVTGSILFLFVRFHLLGCESRATWPRP